MSAKTDKCSDNNKSVCDYNDFSRLRFFHGMLLDDKDFRAEQQYHANKRRFLNRMLHGSGVVCGLELQGEKEKRSLTLTRGFALDCSGNEIWVSQEVPIDICSLLPPPQKGKGPCEETAPGKPKSYCIGIRYQERETNPVSVYLPSGSCEERTCENSRIKEGYCVEIVDCCAYDEKKDGVLKGLCDCKNGKLPDLKGSKQICRNCGKEPDANATPEERETWCDCVVLEEFCEASPACAECCCSDHPCFVLLGRIEVDEKCQLVSVCNNECRKYVLTPNLLRHLLIGGFAGYEQNVEFKVNGQLVTPPTATEIVDNPVKALCWVVDNIVIKKGSAEFKNCGKKEPSTSQTAKIDDLNKRIYMLEEKVPGEIKRLNDQVEFLRRQFTQVNSDVNDVRVDNLIKRNPTTQEQASDKKNKK